MLFLEEVLERSPQGARSRLSVGRRGIRPGQNNEICASIAIEYIAQTAALAGKERTGEETAGGRRGGYLIGVRELSSSVSSFKIGQILRVTAHLDGEGPSLKTFTGSIEDELTGLTLVTAKFSVYEEGSLSNQDARFPCLKKPGECETERGEEGNGV